MLHGMKYGIIPDAYMGIIGCMPMTADQHIGMTAAVLPDGGGQHIFQFNKMIISDLEKGRNTPIILFMISATRHGGLRTAKEKPGLF